MLEQSSALLRNYFKAGEGTAESPYITPSATTVDSVIEILGNSCTDLTDKQWFEFNGYTFSVDRNLNIDAIPQEDTGHSTYLSILGVVRKSEQRVKDKMYEGRAKERNTSYSPSKDTSSLDVDPTQAKTTSTETRVRNFFNQILRRGNRK